VADPDLGVASIAQPTVTTSSPSPSLSSARTAYDIFHEEYLDIQGVAYVGIKGRDLKLLKNIITSGTVTEEQLKRAVRGMLNDGYALDRGAGVNILAANWNEWLTKGEHLAAYPSGRQVAVPRIAKRIHHQRASTDSGLNSDIPAERMGAHWDLVPEDIRQAVLDAIFDSDLSSVLMHGLPGTAKSTTAAAMAIRLRSGAEREGQERFHVESLARFISQAEFTQRALDTTFLEEDEGHWADGRWNGATRGSMYVNRVMRFPGILVLDDVVHEKAPAKLAPPLIAILNHRHENNLMTIITSNLSPAQIAKKLDPAVASRLCGGLVLHFVGEDLRRDPAEVISA